LGNEDNLQFAIIDTVESMEFLYMLRCIHPMTYEEACSAKASGEKKIAVKQKHQTATSGN
jgi:hypothetical protein